MKDNSMIRTLIVIAIILAIGVAIICINKFQYSLDYSKNVRLEIYTGKSFEIDDIRMIASEVYSGQEALVQRAGAFQDGIAITVRATTEEQNEALLQKLNEKYETTLTIDDIEIYYNSNVRGRDLIRPYYWVAGIAGILILVFFGVRYHALGISKVIGSVLGITLVGVIIYLTLVSICNIKISSITIASMIAILVFSFAYLSANYEKAISAKK